MNLPNRLTVIRFILAPVFMILLVVDFPWHFFVAMLVFIAASVTDYLDGKIAREQNLVTDFGKFLDPIADKMITTAAFLAFTYLKIGSGIVWITFIVLLREFVIASVRLSAAGGGKVVAANMWGKTKTVVQMLAIILTLFLCFIAQTFEISPVLGEVFDIVCTVVLWVSAVLTFISGVTYIIDNKKFVDVNK